MYLTKKTKEDLFKKHGKDAKDTGSAEGQIAVEGDDCYYKD